MAPPSLTPDKPTDIVLLEESELYRFEDGGHGMGSSGYYQQKSSFASAGAPPSFHAEPVKYTPSVHSHRSHQSGHRSGYGPPGPGSYAMHATPFGASTAKRTASIDTIPAHYGALRPGGPVDLFTKDYIGLLLNWMIVGFFNGAIPGLIYPLFGSFLGFSRTQQTATFALFDFGWYFKFIFGFITDNYPINRQRRKPYMFIGWGIFICFMLAMTFMNKVAWFGPDKEHILNADAPNQGARYVIPIMISSFAHLLANVACEGMMVEFAHREGEYDRGRTQLWCIVARFTGEVSGGVFAALGLASEEYGGRFAHSIPLSWYFASLAILAVGGLLVTHFLLHEDQVPSTKQSFGSNLRRVWRFIEQRVTLQVMVSLFFLSIAINVTVVEYASIFSDWFKTDSLAQSLVTIFQTTGYILAAGALYFWFLNTNWRVLVLASFAIAVVIQLPIEMLAVWNVVRSSALFLGKDWVAGIFEAVVFIVRIMVVVEVAEPGIESTTYGFLTTVCNLENALGRVAYNLVSSSWPKEITDLSLDTDRVRWHITYEFIVKYGMRFALAAIACALLPRQKRHLKEIKIRGAPNLIVPVVLFIVVAGLFAAAITSALMSMFESTLCLKFAGGSGCK
jgi:hypothetical protein